MQLATCAWRGIFDRMKCFGATNEDVSMTESTFVGAYWGPCHVDEYQICHALKFFAQLISSIKLHHFDIVIWRQKRCCEILAKLFVSCRMKHAFFATQPWNSGWTLEGRQCLELFVTKSIWGVGIHSLSMSISDPSYFVHFYIQPAMRSLHRCGLAAQNYRPRSDISWVDAKSLILIWKINWAGDVNPNFGCHSLRFRLWIWRPDMNVHPEKL